MDTLIRREREKDSRTDEEIFVNEGYLRVLVNEMIYFWNKAKEETPLRKMLSLDDTGHLNALNELFNEAEVMRIGDEINGREKKVAERDA